MYKKILILVLLVYVSSLAQHDTAIVYLGEIDSTITSDVRYATKNNFTGEILYPTDKVYIRKIVGEALSRAHLHLQENYNLGIKVFDAFRPLSVQKMWEVFPNSNYVADPAKGSKHNRGAAVDITIIDQHGKEIDMGTEYDNFTERAHFDYKNLTKEVKNNRKLLRGLMIKFGFEPITTEWWHFDFKGWRNFSILDMDLN